MVCDVGVAVSPTNGKLGVLFCLFFHFFLIPLVMHKLHIAALNFSFFKIILVLICKNRIDKLVFHIMACELNPVSLPFMNWSLVQNECKIS